jgi:sigma-70-like protein
MAGTASSPIKVPLGHSRVALGITATGTRVRSGSSSMGRPVYPAPERWPQGQWRPRPRVRPAASTPDTPEASPVPLQADAPPAWCGELAPGDPRRVSLSAKAIESYLPTAVYLARRFAGRGEPRADLIQVAVVAGTDHGPDAGDDRETLRAQLAALPAREQLVIGMRFSADMTRAQIVAEIVMSQMHVSRMLARTPTQLRGEILTDDDRAPSYGGTRRSPGATQRPARRAADRSPGMGIGDPSLCAGG